MRILIFGGNGMLGHRLFMHFRGRHQVRVTLRQEFSAYAACGLFGPEDAYTGVDASSMSRLAEVMADYHPEAVINAIGVIKQRPTAKESIPSIEINSLLPHRLAVLCQACGARLIHMSTDCIFSGTRGQYTESDPCDPVDLYGRSKLLGEVDQPGCLTIRTSMIGYEIGNKHSLLEWFLAQCGKANGFTKAVFSGLTTLELAGIIEKILLEHPQAQGIYHVSGAPISKYDLLMLIKRKLGLDIEIEPDGRLRIDRSLDSSRFRREFDYSPPSWEDMIEELGRVGRFDTHTEREI